MTTKNYKAYTGEGTYICSCATLESMTKALQRRGYERVCENWYKTVAVFGQHALSMYDCAYVAYEGICLYAEDYEN